MSATTGGRLLGHVSGKAMEDICREVVEDFKAMDPVEYEAWRKWVKGFKDSLANEKGISVGGELMATCSIPMYVDLMIGRISGDPLWRLDWKNMEAVWRAFPECRINTTTGARCSGD